MLAILDFLFNYILDPLLFLLEWAIIISAVISWLVAFDVINLRNRAAYTVAHYLEAITRPVLRPLQRVVPVLGGIDISPIITILIIHGIRKALLPALHGFLASLLA